MQLAVQRAKTMHGAAQIVAPVISRHKQVETCLECSAKKLAFVGEVFYYAIKAVVYPVAPLFDVHAHGGAGAMRPAAIKALKRIFLMCDRDKVGTVVPVFMTVYVFQAFSRSFWAKPYPQGFGVLQRRSPQGSSGSSQQFCRAGSAAAAAKGCMCC